MTESLIGFAVLLLVVFLGFPLGFAMVMVGFFGFGYIRGWEPALETVGQLILDFSMSYSFSVLPLFVLMGTFVYRAGLLLIRKEFYSTCLNQVSPEIIPSTNPP